MGIIRKKKGFRELLIVTISTLLVFNSGCNEMEKIKQSETFKNSILPPAPGQLYIKPGQIERLNYIGQNITINYISAYPIHTLKVTIDGNERDIQKNISDNPRGIFWREGNFSFALKPVIWENRDSQVIPIYERTWNTTELYFEVFNGG